MRGRSTPERKRVGLSVSGWLMEAFMKDGEEEQSKAQAAPVDQLWTTGQSKDVVTLIMTSYYQAPGG